MSCIFNNIYHCFLQVKHVSISKKVNAHLDSGDQLPVDERLPMMTWLNRLETHLHISMPKRRPGEMPSASEVFNHVQSIVDLAHKCVNEDESEFGVDGEISLKTAWEVQRAVLAMLISGSHVPPCRLHILKTLLHPDYAGKMPCPDRDCLQKSKCKGNYLEVIESPDPEDGEEVPRGPKVRFIGEGLVVYACN